MQMDGDYNEYADETLEQEQFYRSDRGKKLIHFY